MAVAEADPTGEAAVVVDAGNTNVRETKRLAA